MSYKQYNLKELLRPELLKHLFDILLHSSLFSKNVELLGGIYTELHSSDDLDNIKATGLYYWGSSADSPRNAKIAVGSLMLVWNAGYGTFQVQLPNTYYATIETQKGIWVRGCWASSFGTWVNLI